MQTTELLTSAQAAVILGKSARTVQRMVDAGEIAAAQKLPGPNGAYLFAPTEVERVRTELAAIADAEATA